MLFEGPLFEHGLDKVMAVGEAQSTADCMGPRRATFVVRRDTLRHR